MAIIGSIIGGALGLGSQLYGGFKASQAMKDIRRNLLQQQRENRDWYDRRYNENPTQRADAQQLLTQTQEAIRNRNRAAAGRAAVMGGTSESVAAEKAANNALMADATSRIAAANTASKDRVEELYMKQNAALNGALNQMEENRANNVTKAIGGTTTASGELGAAIDEILNNK